MKIKQEKPTKKMYKEKNLKNIAKLLVMNIYVVKNFSTNSRF